MHARNASLQRLRKITRIVGVGTAALTGIFAGLAAASNSGHHRHLLAQARPTRRSTPEASPNRIPAPPALPPLSGEGGGGSEASPPAPPAQPPVQTESPPAVVTGAS
jgi:hypothetical protein